MTTAEAFIDELKREAANTRRVLERVPEDQFSWKPHSKSDSLGQLALHVANLPGAIAELVSERVRDIPMVPRPEAKSVADLLAVLDRGVESASAKISAWGDEGLRETWTMKRDGKTLLELPRLAVIRTIMLNHSYHHRGQLTVYLRLLGVPLPAIYGASADESMFG